MRQYMHTISIFGEADIGSLQSLISITSLPELADKLGNPTQTGIGMHMAIQALLFDREILYYRIRTEGHHLEEYIQGFHLLSKTQSPLVALALPAVNNSEILYNAKHYCRYYHIPLICNERQLFDFIILR